MSRDINSHRYAYASIWALAVLLAGLGPISGACESNQQGHRVAPEGGDLRFGPAPRQAFDEEIRRACSPLGSSDGQPFYRAPYLQFVTETQANLVWTGDTGPFAVALEGPEGRRVVLSEVDTSASPANGEQYITTIDQLSPNTLYCYQVEQDDTGLYRGGFRTAPGPDSSIRFSAMGDLGKRSADQFAVLAQLQTVASDVLLITGDIAYDSGTLAQFENYFFGVYHDVLALVPVFPASGNHDYGTADGAAFRQVFVLPENGGDAGRERWYSFEWGPVHFSVLDTQTMLPEQADWLRDDLRASTRDWKVVVLHKPPYASGFHGSDAAVQEILVPVFVQEGVDLVLAGHEHHYERTDAIDGVTYVITGGGGQGTRSVGSSSFTAFAARVAHFVYVEADATTLTLHAISAAGTEFDSMQLTR